MRICINKLKDYRVNKASNYLGKKFTSSNKFNKSKMLLHKIVLINHLIWKLLSPLLGKIKTILLRSINKLLTNKKTK